MHMAMLIGSFENSKLITHFGTDILSYCDIIGSKVNGIAPLKYP